MADKIKVLIVDDSRIFRSIIETALNEDPEIEVIGSVFNGEKAMQFIESGNIPDIVTLDIEMPIMNGIKTLEAIEAFNRKHTIHPNISAIMISSISVQGAAITMEALSKGAFDYITKQPAEDYQKNREILRESLLTKIKALWHKRTKNGLKQPAQDIKKEIPRTIIPNTQANSTKYNAIVIGCSTGGPKALYDVLPSLTKVTSLPIFIVQHMPPLFTSSLADNLDRICEHTVKEAQDNEIISNKTVYIAPGGHHLVLRKSSSGEIVTAIANTPPENNCKPSVDVFFRSVPMAIPQPTIALILTGMGNDGAKSLRILKRTNTHIIAQDEQSSVVWGMPGSAVETGYVDTILPLNQIVPHIETLL